MGASKYYNEIINRQYPFSFFEYAIKWNVEEIAGKKDANGFIVQRIEVDSSISNSGVPKKPYLEAWSVTNGVCADTRLNKYDDIFSVGIDFRIHDSVIDSLGVLGHIIYKTKVYWVDICDHLFEDVEKWEVNCIPSHVGNLKACWIEDFSKFEELSPVFERTYVHHVDFRDKDVIKKSILQVINESEIKELVIRELKEEMVNSPYGVILSELNL